MPLCEECNKPLRIFKKRLDFNGKDLNGRELHLACWKRIEHERKYKILLERMHIVANAFKTSLKKKE